MGLLDARANAEKVTYPVIGEEKKDASDIIDYNINEEITIDTSSVFNANNDTTTGMATVIPGVNAPKLIQSTSIYNNVVDKASSVRYSASGSQIIDQGQTKTGLLLPISLSNQRGPAEFKVGDYFNGANYITNGCVIIPASGVYKLKLTYYCRVNIFYRSYDVMLNLDTVRHLQNDNYYSQTGSAYPTEEFYINANKGDQLTIYYIAYCSGGGTGNTIQYSVSGEILKV